MGRLGVGAGLCLAVIVSGCGESRRAEDSTAGGTGGADSAGSAGTGSGQTGSGGATAGGGTSGSDSGGSGGQPDGSVAEFFVESRVDGELIRADVDVRAYWFQGLVQGYLYVQAFTNEFEWGLIVRNYDGADSCGAGTLALMEYEGDAVTYHMSDPFVETTHGCSLSVDRTAPNVGDVIEGTFSGVLTTLSGGPNATISVTEGAFRARRVEDNPPR